MGVHFFPPARRFARLTFTKHRFESPGRLRP